MITPHVVIVPSILFPISKVMSFQSTFDTAQRRVVNLLQNDAYPRFLRWSVYQRLAYPESLDNE